MKKIKKPLISILFAVLIFTISVLTKIPISTGYVSLGDAFVLLAACFLPTGYAMLAALLGCSAAAYMIGGPQLILSIVLIRVLAACWFVDTGKKILDKRLLTGVIASAFILIVGSYIADMAKIGDIAAPLVNMPIYAVAVAANIVLFLILAFICDFLKLRPRLMNEKEDATDQATNN